jgi:hypothetical protein
MRTSVLRIGGPALSGRSRVSAGGIVATCEAVSVRP